MPKFAVIKIPTIVEHELFFKFHAKLYALFPSVYILSIPKVVSMLLDVPLVFLYNTIDDT